jgi:hypothetical protein
LKFKALRNYYSLGLRKGHRMSYFPKHYEGILRESGLSNITLSKLFDMPQKRLDNIRHSSCRLDCHEFKLIKAFVNGYEAAQKNIKEAKPSTSTNKQSTPCQHRYRVIQKTGDIKCVDCGSSDVEYLNWRHETLKCNKCDLEMEA